MKKKPQRLPKKDNKKPAPAPAKKKRFKSNLFPANQDSSDSPSEEAFKP